MATDNNGTTYINRNVCRTFNFALSTTLQAFTNQICSEVVVMNRTGQSINLYDNGFVLSGSALLLEDNESFTIRGLTNAMQLSAATVTGGGTLYYRTQYYSSSTQ